MRPEDFITSDTHFGHSNIIRYCSRPFDSVEDMDRELVDRWNAKVPKGATVYHLGDFCFYKDPAQALEVLHSLNGDIHLIAGNHDNWWEKNGCVRDKWRKVVDCFATIDHGVAEHRLAKKLIVMCHYPIESWNGKFHNSWHFHGHSHGTSRSEHLRIDVGVDCTKDYAPTKISELVPSLSHQESILDAVRGKSL